ncbi:MAG: hypothetical protein ACUVV4_05975 [Candidatus Bathyarchaeia archaeon]
MKNRCMVCNREKESDTGFCHRHEKAYQNLKKVYFSWKKAVDIDWEGYLEEIITIPETGTWVKEVALNLLKNKER